MGSGVIVPLVLVLVGVWNFAVLLNIVNKHQQHKAGAQASTKESVEQVTALLSQTLKDINFALPHLQGVPQTSHKGTPSNAVSVDGLEPDGHNQITNTKYGLMIYNKNDAYVGKSLELYGEWHESEVELFRKLIQKGDTVVDVGANIGAITLPLSKFTGDSGVVYAFEPQRVLHQMLCANAQLNQRRNILSYVEVVSDKPGSMAWFVHPDSYLTFSNFADFPIKSNIREKVSYEVSGEHDEPVIVSTLDQHHLKGRVTLVKISVSPDMVLEVLRGAKNTITEFQPVLYLNKPSDTLESTQNWLHEHGYKLWEHENFMFRDDNFKKSTNSELNFVSTHLLAISEHDYENNVHGVKDVVTNTKDLKPVED